MSGARTVALVLALGLLAGGCSGGGGGSGSDDTGAGGDAALAASFAADAQPAGADSVSLQAGAKAGDEITVQVALTDTGGIFSVAFDLTFDPARVKWLAANEGGLLDSDGAATQFLVSAGAGRLVVGATRLQDGTGGVPDVSAVGSQVLATFRFRVLEAGDSRVDFDASRPRQVTDRDGIVQPLSWSGGTLLAN